MSVKNQSLKKNGIFVKDNSKLEFKSIAQIEEYFLGKLNFKDLHEDISKHCDQVNYYSLEFCKQELNRINKLPRAEKLKSKHYKKRIEEQKTIFEEFFDLGPKWVMLIPDFLNTLKKDKGMFIEYLYMKEGFELKQNAESIIAHFLPSSNEEFVNIILSGDECSLEYIQNVFTATNASPEKKEKAINIILDTFSKHYVFCNHSVEMKKKQAGFERLKNRFQNCSNLLSQAQT